MIVCEGRGYVDNEEDQAGGPGRDWEVKFVGRNKGPFFRYSGISQYLNKGDNLNKVQLPTRCEWEERATEVSGMGKCKDS